MNVLHIIGVLAAAGVFLWFINEIVTIIDGRVKKLINWVVLGAIVWWLMKIFGVISYLSSLTV